MKDATYKNDGYYFYIKEISRKHYGVTQTYKVVCLNNTPKSTRRNYLDKGVRAIDLHWIESWTADGLLPIFFRFNAADVSDSKGSCKALVITT